MKLKQLQKRYVKYKNRKDTKNNKISQSSTMALLSSYIIMSVMLILLYMIMQSGQFSIPTKCFIETIFLIILVVYGFILIYLHTKSLVDAEGQLEKYKLLHKESIAAYYSMTMNHDNVTIYQEFIVKQLENKQFFSTYIHQLLDEKRISIDFIPIHHKKSTSFELMKLEVNIPKKDGSYYNIYEIRAFDNDTYHQIYYYVFEQACIKMAALKSLGREIKVITNLTVSTLERDRFLDKVLHMLDQYHIGVEQIWFELYNTNFTNINEESIIPIFKLSEKGFSLVLGDSLKSNNYLGIIPRLPVDVINLGSNLVVGALNSMKEYQYLDSLIIALNQLELKTMVTGIDDRQLKRLAERMNIDYICGKVYDDSQPIDEYGG